jgi:hypothetical protein
MWTVVEGGGYGVEVVAGRGEAAPPAGSAGWRRLSMWGTRLLSPVGATATVGRYMRGSGLGSV